MLVGSDRRKVTWCAGLSLLKILLTRRTGARFALLARREDRVSPTETVAACRRFLEVNRVVPSLPSATLRLLWRGLPRARLHWTLWLTEVYSCLHRLFLLEVWQVTEIRLRSFLTPWQVRVTRGVRSVSRRVCRPSSLALRRVSRCAQVLSRSPLWRSRPSRQPCAPSVWWQSNRVSSQFGRYRSFRKLTHPWWVLVLVRIRERLLPFTYIMGQSLVRQSCRLPWGLLPMWRLGVLGVYRTCWTRFGSLLWTLKDRPLREIRGLAWVACGDRRCSRK